jgi:hypothetical protein
LLAPRGTVGRMCALVFGTREERRLAWGWKGARGEGIVQNLSLGENSMWNAPMDGGESRLRDVATATTSFEWNGV